MVTKTQKVLPNICPFFLPFPVNLSDYSVTQAYTHGGLYTVSSGSRVFRGFILGGGLIHEGGLYTRGAYSRSSTVYFGQPPCLIFS